jgi:hypothetical protein
MKKIIFAFLLTVSAVQMNAQDSTATFGERVEQGYSTWVQDMFGSDSETGGLLATKRSQDWAKPHAFVGISGTPSFFTSEPGGSIGLEAGAWFPSGAQLFFQYRLSEVFLGFRTPVTGTSIGVAHYWETPEKSGFFLRQEVAFSFPFQKNRKRNFAGLVEVGPFFQIGYGHNGKLNGAIGFSVSSQFVPLRKKKS